MQHASNRRRVLTAGLFALWLSSAGAFAADAAPSTGLGQAWPNAVDVSASPHWHVYVFERNGVRYVQINDLNGKVRAAIATAGGNFLALPIGADASRVATPQEPLAAPASASPGEIVYQDGTVKMLVTPDANGAARVYAADGDCKDPIECSARIN
ncbi:MAG TPA: hypothetical protein VFG49_19010 [Dyella sp.]|uniref:hypothetical protein n=1 Tax=Dyella sp. TaxID=1869338 RepID=UPI002D7848E6|nr:hypothetical protein [Dyella sp.]HET6555626.1 hypothetical protein [Dyella sp.]